MDFKYIEQLKRQFTDKYVVVESPRADLARFANMTGIVRTVNMNGRALVEFDGHNNIGWYDLELSSLRVVDKPLPKPAKESRVAARSAPPKTKEPASSQQQVTSAAAESAEPSTAEILAAARAGKSGTAATPPASTAAAEKEPAAKSPSEPDSATKSPPEQQPAAAPKKAAALSTAEILDWCRQHDGHR